MSSLLRIGLLLVAGLVLLARGMEMLNTRITDASRPAPRSAAAAAEAAMQAEAEAMGVDAPPASSTAPAAPSAGSGFTPSEPPADDEQLLALQFGDERSIEDTLRRLRGRASTPELQAALAVAATRTSTPRAQRYLTCLRARQPGAPLDDVFASLPATPPDHPDWRDEAVDCLIGTIAARAGDEPQRARPVLVERALLGDASTARDALVRLDPAPIPDAVTIALRQPDHRRTRPRAVAVGVYVGAATTAPDLVDAWLDDADGEVRQTAILALLARPDDASQAAGARAIAATPADQAMEQRVLALVRDGKGFDRHLAALVVDATAPNFVRANAAWLVSQAGSEPSARAVAAVQSSDATVAPAIALARRVVEQRFGKAPGGAR
jgi:hypothetical protein